MRKTPIILVACQPKSASTFLCKSIAERAGGRTRFLSASRGRGEQEFARRKLWRAGWARSPLIVSQQHVRYSRSTAALIRDFDVKVAVLRRNLFDVVCSIRDHVRQEDPEMPVFYCDQGLAALPDADLELLIARMAIPWYLNFHLSWRQAEDVIDVSYDDIAADPAKVVDDVLDHANFPVGRRRSVGLLQADDSTRLNMGVSGRGREMSEAAITAVRTLVETYADHVDDPYLAAHFD